VGGPDEMIPLLAAGNHRTDLDLILIREDFILGDQLIAADDQVCLNQQVQLAQEISRLLWAFNLHDACRMAQLDPH
jgi:hypothetical protein